MYKKMPENRSKEIPTVFFENFRGFCNFSILNEVINA